MKLKLYTDLGLVACGTPVDLLIPFVGIQNEEYSTGRLYAHTFDQYIATASEYIELTSLAECEACLLPIYYDPNWDRGSKPPLPVSEFIATVSASKKKVFVYSGHDVPITQVSIPNAIVFSGAINKKDKPENLYSYPHFFADLLAYNQTPFKAKAKDEKAIVGFCGYAPPLGIPFGKEKVISSLKLAINYLGLFKFFPEKVSHSYRTRSIISLSRSKKIQTNFKIKRVFAFGPNGQLNTGNSAETDTDFRKNFINNILESDYTLCVRGIGNNSIRFFETLCCGRIPVFINTDSVLPFEHVVDWKKYCVWIEEEDIGNIGTIVQAFHERISNEDFSKLQSDLRQLWLEYLSPVGYYKNLRLFL